MRLIIKDNKKTMDIVALATDVQAKHDATVAAKVTADASAKQAASDKVAEDAAHSALAVAIQTLVDAAKAEDTDPAPVAPAASQAV